MYDAFSKLSIWLALSPRVIPLVAITGAAVFSPSMSGGECECSFGRADDGTRRVDAPIRETASAQAGGSEELVGIRRSGEPLNQP